MAKLSEKQRIKLIENKYEKAINDLLVRMQDNTWGEFCSAIEILREKCIKEIEAVTIKKAKVV